METLIVFALLSIPVIIVSSRSLKIPWSHGFYRFFGWEGILFLAVCNIRFWFTDAFSIAQIISWICLFYALYLVIAGVLLLQGKGESNPNRQDPTLFSFEKTTKLVETGLFRYIRHPLYGSLLFLTWGIFMKHVSVSLLYVALFSTVMFYLTARMDEKECIAYFGDIYRAYMKRTKMFVPFVF